MRQVSAQICHPQARFLHPITSQFIALYMLKFISLPFNNLKAILLIQEKNLTIPPKPRFPNGISDNDYYNLHTSDSGLKWKDVMVDFF